jgi:hypothetical protein
LLLKGKFSLIIALIVGAVEVPIPEMRFSITRRKSGVLVFILTTRGWDIALMNHGPTSHEWYATESIWGGSTGEWNLR